MLLIDGPAGIGKTEFIKQIAFARATTYQTNQLPLFLHVQSRGRVLTYLQDLIAFSLQTLRLSVTYDQVPVLVRNGLIVLAIDGFDELGDPAGYGSAWAQVNELMAQVRGHGQIILAGRETFIGRDRIKRDIKTLNDNDNVDSLTLQLIEPASAKSWLRKNGWNDQSLNNYDELFERGAFSLRPLFLRRLGDASVVQDLAVVVGTSPIPLLIDIMIRREADKFGEPVEAVLNHAERETFVRSFLGEIARDMADNQSDAADNVSITWAVESALPESVPDEIRHLLINRALVMAFLALDERPGYRRFAHSQLQNFFLGVETIGLVAASELPKYIRRNIIGSDFLVTFCEVLEFTSSRDSELLKKFILSGMALLERYVDVDRGGRNLAALMISCAPFADLVGRIELSGQNLDDALVRGTSSTTILKGYSINQLDVRDADVSQIGFVDSVVVALVMNGKSKLSPTLCPHFAHFEDHETGAVSLVTPDELDKVLDKYGGPKIDREDEVELESKIISDPLWLLLERVARNTSHWIKANDDEAPSNAKIIRDDNWPIFLRLLKKYDLVREDSKRGTSGSPSLFYHIRQKDAIFFGSDDQNIIGFRDEIRKVISERILPGA